MDHLTLDTYWLQALSLIEQRMWPEAEGLLLRLLLRTSANPLIVRDALAYVQLEQGDYLTSLDTLEPVLHHPERHFWIAHKAGDCWRGLGIVDSAVACYEQAISDGSDSLLTFRNLLEILDEPSVLQKLVVWAERYGSSSEEAWLLGAQVAATHVSHWTIGSWLISQGLANAAVQQLHIQYQLYNLDFSGISALTDSTDPWCVQLALRLSHLQFTS